MILPLGVHVQQHVDVGLTSTLSSEGHVALLICVDQNVNVLTNITDDA